MLLILSVGSIWVFKDANNSESIDNSTGAISDNSNPDFVLNVTEKIDMEKLKSYGLPIVIDFGADSCIPCKEMEPVLKELNTDLQGKAMMI